MKHTVVGFGPQEAEEKLRGKPYLNDFKVPGEEYWKFPGNYVPSSVRIAQVLFRLRYAINLSQRRTIYNIDYGI